MNEFITGLPGIMTSRAAAPRKVLVTTQGVIRMPKMVSIDGTLSGDAGNTPDVDVLRAGVLMGKITTGGKYRNSIVGKSNLAYTDNELAIQMDLATATEIARLKTAGGGGNLSMLFIGPPTAGGTVAETAITVTAVTLNGATSTVTVADLGLNKVTDSLLCLADGSKTPVAIVEDSYGILLSDIDKVRKDVPLDRLVVAGVVDVNQIVNYPADASTKAWVKAQLRLGGGEWIFSDDF